MNRSQFLTMLAALALVGSAGLILLHRDGQTWTAHEAMVGAKVLPGLQINDVAVIHIKGGNLDFNVVHTNGAWCVRERNDYPAAYGAIRDLLLKLRDLSVAQSDLIGPTELARLNLNPPGTPTNSATLLEFKDEHGRLLASLLAGKQHLRLKNDSEPAGLHGLFDGRYILLPGDPGNALLVSDDLAAATPDPGIWLSPDFFKAENAKFVSFTSPDAAASWEISRPDASSPWVLDNAKPNEILNQTAAAAIGEIIEFPTFDDVAPKTAAQLAAHGLDKPTVLTVLTEHFAYTLKIGRREVNGDYPLTVSVDGSVPDSDPDAADLRKKLAKERALAPWIYEAGSWIGRAIRDRSQLVDQTTPPGGMAAAQ